MKRFNHNSALATRFQEILETKASSSSSSDLHKILQQKLADKLSEESKFDAQYSNQLGYLKSENLLKLNKHGAQIAKSKPWDGQETTKDASLRMIIDSKPKPKKTKNQGKRLVMAKEISNEYKETKVHPLNEEKDHFKKLYQERFLGPSMLLNTSNTNVTMNLINSVASSKINSKINLATGQFDDVDMSKVRGKPLNKQHLNNATNTTYFVNQILNKQEVLPPWIENQQTINHEIKQFRSTMDFNLVRLVRNHGNIPQKQQLKKMFNQTNHNYVNEKIKLINKSIRDYNLQAPSVNFHKMKLEVEEEIEITIDRIYDKLPELITSQDYEVLISNTNQGFLSLFDAAKAVPQRPVEKLRLWESFKQMFSEIRNQSNDEYQVNSQ